MVPVRSDRVVATGVFREHTHRTGVPVHELSRTPHDTGESARWPQHLSNLGTCSVGIREIHHPEATRRCIERRVRVRELGNVRDREREVGEPGKGRLLIGKGEHRRRPAPSPCHAPGTRRRRLESGPAYHVRSRDQGPADRVRSRLSGATAQRRRAPCDSSRTASTSRAPRSLDRPTAGDSMQTMFADHPQRSRLRTCFPCPIRVSRSNAHAADARPGSDDLQTDQQVHTPTGTRADTPTGVLAETQSGGWRSPGSIPMAACLLPKARAPVSAECRPADGSLVPGLPDRSQRLLHIGDQVVDGLDPHRHAYQ